VCDEVTAARRASDVAFVPDRALVVQPDDAYPVVVHRPKWTVAVVHDDEFPCLVILPLEAAHRLGGHVQPVPDRA
jgi:hypothetical protein